MEFLKKNPHYAVLGIISVVLLAISALLIVKASGFADSFEGLYGSPSRNDKVAEKDMAAVNTAKESLLKPKQWLPTKPAGAKEATSLFVADKHVVKEDPSATDGIKLEKIEGGGSLYPPVPNQWLYDNQISLASRQSALLDDSDGDGFSNLEEFLGADHLPVADGGKDDGSNPKDKASHPATHTQLRLLQFRKIPFRLMFNAYDGIPGKTPVERMSFQINTLDLRQPSEFLSIGDMIKNTKYKIEKFEFKEVKNLKTEEMEDASELTLVNTEFGESIKLVLRKLVDSPDSRAIFGHYWPDRTKPTNFEVRRQGAFVLKPDSDAAKAYKLIDIKDEEAVIQSPSGEQLTIKKSYKYDELR